MAFQIVEKGLTVREAEHLEEQRLLHPPDRKIPAKPDGDALRLHEETPSGWVRQGTIKSNRGGKGRLIINYNSHEQLEDML